MKRRDENQFTFKILKVFKGSDEKPKMLVNEQLLFNLKSGCCNDKIKTHGSYFVMGTQNDGILNPSFIMPWGVKKSKVSKLQTLSVDRLYSSNIILLCDFSVFQKVRSYAENARLFKCERDYANGHRSDVDCRA